MRHYEIVLLIRPKKANSIKELLVEYRKIITEGKGTLHRCEESGRRELAYSMEKNSHAYFIVTNIEVSTETLNAIKHQLRFNTAVMRHLITKQDQAITGDSPLLELKSKEK